MSYTYTEPVSLRYSASQVSPTFLPELPSLDSGIRESTSRSIDRNKWKLDQIFQHNKQLLKENEILSKRLAEVDKGIVALSSHQQGTGRESLEMSKALAEVMKERDQLLVANRVLQSRLDQMENQKENRLSELNSKFSLPNKGEIEQIQVLEKRLNDIQKNGKSSEEEIFKLKRELEAVIQERDRILRNYQKEKEISQSIVKSMKKEIQDNRLKEKKVVEIVKILEVERGQVEAECQRLRNVGMEKDKEKIPETKDASSRVQELEQQLELVQQTVSDLNSLLIKKENFISKTLREHKSRLTKALQSYIERIGISKKLKPAQLLRQRSSVLSEWDLNLDVPVEYQ